MSGDKKKKYSFNDERQYNIMVEVQEELLLFDEKLKGKLGKL